MEKRQTANESKEDTAKALKQKTNQDFNGKKPLPNDPDMKKETPESEAPETETPGIGDDKKKDPMPDEIIGEDKKRGSTDEQYKPEPVTEDKPLNSQPDEVVEGDSDAPSPIINKQDDGKVF